MARYIGPKTRISRKFKEPIFGPDKSFEKRNYPPGQHGLNKKRSKLSEYATQLKEKQKVKYTYGILERQFAKTFDRASRAFALIVQLATNRSRTLRFKRTRPLPYFTNSIVGWV